jgi:hypothetical protein
MEPTYNLINGRELLRIAREQSQTGSVQEHSLKVHQPGTSQDRIQKNALVVNDDTKWPKLSKDLTTEGNPSIETAYFRQDPSKEATSFSEEDKQYVQQDSTGDSTIH